MPKLPWWSQVRIIDVLVMVLMKLGFKSKNRLFQIKTRNCLHPLWARFATSDVAVFNQIFTEQEYSCLKDVETPKLILDCGANVGYSTVWFLNQYPDAKIIAIEPNRANFKLCQKNTEPYQDRVSLVRAAIWPNQSGLTIIKGSDGRDWSWEVRECQNSEQPDFYGISINDLLEKSGFEKIDILKIDIEKSEKVVFSKNLEWLENVKNIVIELHDEECKEIFFKALSAFSYELSRSGELTVCKNLTAKPLDSKHVKAQPSLRRILNPSKVFRLQQQFSLSNN